MTPTSLKYAYAHEKLSDAIRILATHPGNLRERLVVAFNPLSPISSKDFPPSLQKDWDALKSRSTKSGPIIDNKGIVTVGSLYRTLGNARYITLTKIAEELFSLFENLKDAMNNDI